MKTYVPKEGDVTKRWILIDAEGKVLGRVATEAARILRGKHKPQYTPYLDCGDGVIVINAAKAIVTGKKMTDKMYHHHSGYPGGITSISYGDMLRKHPDRAMYMAIKGMLPHNKLGSALATHVRVYAGSEHPHVSQNPIVHTITK